MSGSLGMKQLLKGHTLPATFRNPAFKLLCLGAENLVPAGTK